MENLIHFAAQHAEVAHWLFALLILLGGLNVPISEDIVLISAGALASTLTPHAALYQYTILFLVCWVAAWETYWIGRGLGPKLYKISWFSRLISPAKIARLRLYYEKFGIWTFIVGRFIPGGVRNGLFLTAGLSAMPFKVFIIRDLPACLLSTLFLFNLGYFFGQHAQEMVAVIHTYHRAIFLTLLAAASLYAVFRYRRRTRLQEQEP